MNPLVFLNIHKLGAIGDETEDYHCIILHVCNPASLIHDETQLTVLLKNLSVLILASSLLIIQASPNVTPDQLDDKKLTGYAQLTVISEK